MKNQDRTNSDITVPQGLLILMLVIGLALPKAKMDWQRAKPLLGAGLRALAEAVEK